MVVTVRRIVEAREMEKEHARSQPCRWGKRAAVRGLQDQEVEVLQAAAIWVGKPLAKGHGGQEEEAGDLLHLAAVAPLDRGGKKMSGVCSCDSITPSA